MYKMLLIASLPLVFAGNAMASAKSFSNPKLEGTSIAACLADGASCGKPAADAFCRMEGYRESILFQRQTVAEALILDSGAICSSGKCEAFSRIKCYQPVLAGDATATLTQ